jgi:hypothetical protein
VSGRVLIFLPTQHPKQKGSMKRNPKWHLKRAVLGAALSIAVTAAAFFTLTTFISSGEHEGTTGAVTEVNKALPMTVSFANGLTPTNPVKLTVEVENNSGQIATAAGPRIEIKTPTIPICGEQWLEAFPETETGEEQAALAARFAGTNTAALEPIPAGVKKDVLTYFNSTPKVRQILLRFKPGLISTTDQTSCASQPVKVIAKLTKPIP